jgi:hypothetical protein
MTGKRHSIVTALAGLWVDRERPRPCFLIIRVGENIYPAICHHRLWVNTTRQRRIHPWEGLIQLPTTRELMITRAFVGTDLQQTAVLVLSNA